MKKRLFAFFIAAAMLFALCACTVKTVERDPSGEKTEQTESTQKTDKKDKKADKEENAEKENEPEEEGNENTEPEPAGTVSAEPEPEPETETKPEQSEYDNFYGSWVLYSGEIEGYRDTAKELGLDVQLVIYGEDKADIIWKDTYNDENDFSFIGMDVVFNDFALYNGCANDKWCADLITGDESREFCAALTGPDEIEMLVFSYFEGEEYPAVFMANFRRMAEPVPEEYSELVTDAFYETTKLYGATLTYAVPHINIDSIRIQALNDAIYEKYYNTCYVKEVKEGMEQYGEPGYGTIDYSWSVADDMLSIIISAEPYSYSWPEYEVYNISISQGRVLTVEEFLAVCCIEYDEYLLGAKNALGSYYCRGYEAAKDYLENSEDEKTFYVEQLMKTIDEENVKLARPYINEYGELMIVGRVYSLAGADYYYECIYYNYPISEDYLHLLREN